MPSIEGGAPVDLAVSSPIDLASSTDAFAAPDLQYATSDIGSMDVGDASLPGWKLLFSDEFNQANGALPDPARWTAEIGGGGWGNQEHEYYTSAAVNSHEESGSLVITATKDNAANYKCWYGTCQYTSARLVSKGKFSVAYGRIEARIQIPFGQGLWPAFWMLGDNIGQAGWPTCGEIDIMENIGREPSRVHGSLHGPGYSGGQALTAAFDLSNGARVADGYHVFSIEWEPGAMRFYVDDNLYETRTPANTGNNKWVFDHPFFIILNVAVGGGWPGNPDNTTTFPQTMKVDWVRAYQK